MSGQGNCFVHVISHQLFSDPTHHLYVRAVGVNYLRQNQKGSLKVILTSHSLPTCVTVTMFQDVLLHTLGFPDDHPLTEDIVLSGLLSAKSKNLLQL